MAEITGDETNKKCNPESHQWKYDSCVGDCICGISSRIYQNPVTSNKCKHKFRQSQYTAIMVCTKCKKNEFTIRAEEDNKAPVASNTGKELKPCPFCGSSNVRKNGNEYQVWCLNDTCGHFFINHKIWQNAWAHKRIAELQKENELLKTITHLCCNEKNETKIASLESSLKGMNKQNEILEAVTHLCCNEKNENIIPDWDEVSRHNKEIIELKTKLAESEKECEEQARLNGMGASREAALMTKLAAVERVKGKNK